KIRDVIFHLREIKRQKCARRRGRLGLRDIRRHGGGASRTVLVRCGWGGSSSRRPRQRGDFSWGRQRPLFVRGRLIWSHITLDGGRLGVCPCGTVYIAENDRQAILAAADNHDF